MSGGYAVATASESAAFLDALGAQLLPRVVPVGAVEEVAFLVVRKRDEDPVAP